MLSCKCFAQNSLSFFIHKALVNSPELYAQKNHLKDIRLDSSLIRASYKTQINLQSDGIYDPVVNGYGYDQIITNGQTLDALVSFDKLIPFKKQLNSQLLANQINRRQSENNFEIYKRQIIREITNQYLATYGDMLQWKYNGTIKNKLEEEKNILKKLSESGIYKQSDYFTFIVNLKKQALLTQDALLQYFADLSKLRILCGIQDTGTVKLEPPQLLLKVPQKTDSSIFFMKYQYDSLALSNKENLIDINYEPKLKIHGDAGYLSALTITPYKNFGAGVGVGLSIPLYDGNQRSLNHQKLKLKEEDLHTQKHFFSQQYQQYTQQYFKQIKALRKQQVAIEQQLKLTKSLIAVDHKLLIKGQVDISQYFLAIQDFIDVKNRQDINQVKIWLLINKANYWN